MVKLFNKNSRKDIEVNEIDDLIGKINLIDIREPFEYRTGSIKSAKNIPMDELLENPDKYLERDKEYHILCRSGARSFSACNKLSSLGFDVVNVDGGVISYIGNNKTK